MDFGQVLVFSLGQLVHAVDVLGESVVAFDEGLLVVHDVLVWWLFESKNLDGAEMGIVDGLNKLEFF